MPVGAARSVALLCKNGHPVTKSKKLRPWQGHVVDRACSGCGRLIDRKDYRWRCEEHCNWDLCDGCYHRHWANIVVAAKGIEDPVRRAELFRAIPHEIRPDDWSLNGGRPKPTQLSLSSAAAAVANEGIGDGSPTTMLGMAWSILKLSTVWLAATMIVSWSGTALLSGDSPLFPNPWLLVGVAHVGALVICKAVASLAGYRSSADSDGVDTTSALVLGAMSGVEAGLYFGVYASAGAGQRHEVYFLRPMFMTAAALLAGTEPPRFRIFLTAAIATAAGALAAPGGADLQELTAATPWLICAGLVTVFRWVFTLNVLPRGGAMAPLWFFAGQLMWPSAAVCFELAFVTNISAYRRLLHLPHFHEVLFLCAPLSLGIAVQTAVELRLVQRASLTVMGLVPPLLNVVSIGLAYALKVNGQKILIPGMVTITGQDLTLAGEAGMILYVLAVVLLWRSRKALDAERAVAQIQEAVYQRWDAPRGASASQPAPGGHARGPPGGPPMGRAWQSTNQARTYG